MNRYLMTSESVSKTHPDRVADAISNAILDQALRIDPNAHVGVEVQCSTQLVVIAGEITLTGNAGDLDVETITRSVIHQLGYTTSDTKFSAQGVKILNNLTSQSKDLEESCNAGSGENAGDNGMMTGFATNLDGTDNLMPLPIDLSHKIMERLDHCRETGQLPGTLPDGKVQVTIAYDPDTRKPQEVTTIVVCQAHSSNITLDSLRDDILNKVVIPVTPENLLTNNTKLLLNPSGRFVERGPSADAGTTGRKLADDTYGGLVPLGGGNPGGKDPTKVDKTGLLLSRHIAKSLVASRLCDEVTVQLAYAIGKPEPVSIHVDTRGTVKDGKTDRELEELITKRVPLTPKSAIEKFGLKRPIWQRMSAYGYLGRDPEEAPWENTTDLS